MIGSCQSHIVLMLGSHKTHTRLKSDASTTQLSRQIKSQVRVKSKFGVTSQVAFKHQESESESKVRRPVNSSENQANVRIKTDQVLFLRLNIKQTLNSNEQKYVSVTEVVLCLHLVIRTVKLLLLINFHFMYSSTYSD